MNIVEYFNDVKAEMVHVSWPTRKTTMLSTGIVIAVSIFAAIYLGAFDFVLSEIVRALI